MRLYVSHTRPDAAGAVSWFVVEHHTDPEAEAQRLGAAGRTVVALDVEPFEGEGSPARRASAVARMARADAAGRHSVAGEDPRMAGALVTLDRTGECADRHLVAEALGRSLAYEARGGKLKLTPYGREYIR